MAFRTVLITSRCKLEYSLNYLVCRGEEEKRIGISEISTLIIQNVGVAITAALLSKLMEAKVKVIFCDPKSNPQGELVSYYDNDGNFEKIKGQLAWKEETKNKLWANIIQEKIRNQARNLSFLKNENATLLQGYAQEVRPGDVSNREGHAARVYFSSCFGSGFSRDLAVPTNAFLNYGYSIILSALNRSVKSLGYLTEFGLHHIGPTNPFNLSCDLMEPLRGLIDYQVLAKKVNEANYKTFFVSLLSSKVDFQGSSMFLENAIQDYAINVIGILNKDGAEAPSFVRYELS